MSTQRSLCFVLMPFGRKPDENGRRIDFDAVYARVIKPAVERAGLECIRADEEKVGGIIHKPMFERLFLCDYAVADLTTANANVFYELGIRHGLRPFTTVLVSAAGSRPPFDLGPVRIQVRYGLNGKGRPRSSPRDAAALQEALTTIVRNAQAPVDDSPVYQLLKGILEAPPRPTTASHLDAFKQRLATAADRRDRIEAARRDKDADALAALEQELREAGAMELADVRTLLLAYRSFEAFDRMIVLIETLPTPLRDAVVVREQYGLALNRKGRGREAEAVLTRLVKEIGPNGETCGILGRVYKDEWDRAKDPHERRRFLDHAIDTYLQGFEADWRDYYPGVNALELMTVRDSDDARIGPLLTVVRYSAQRVAASGARDYWVCATLFELAVLAGDFDEAQHWLDEALKIHTDAMGIRTTLASIIRLRAAAQDHAGQDDQQVARLRNYEAQLQRALSSAG